MTLPPSLADVRARLPQLMLRDQRRLGRRVQQAAALHDAQARERALRRVLADLATATARADARRRAVPAVSYPPQLPVSQRAGEIAAAIRDHQVVIIAGETGSGKTTQLPKICLALGRGVTGQIGHTQPRRIAARTVAERIAAELGTEPGTLVGYQVRFAAKARDDALVKVMTDGILLAELQHDPRLLRYDTLIIDEAHERSLNIDFILGYLKRLLPDRPDLKVIITSATIDPQRFSKAFWDAPVIEVSGRTYPVEVRYRPLAAPDDPGIEPKDQVQGILDAIGELTTEGPGDILVFLSGEREIRDTADALAEAADLEVLPLYARLSAAGQHKVFAPHRGRRVVLATNVAETSLTVPGVRYVIDPGTARISRYSQRTKVQRLPIEPISQASANQRKGRCGRTSDGVCIRLYSEEDFAARPEFTEPEILRTSLASVILRMAALDLGDVAGFPFIDPPESRHVADGVRLLEELGALSVQAGRPRLTSIGRKLAELPADPRLARMIIESGGTGCAREVLVITAALSIVDPRERPADAREAADALHSRFAWPGSDFLAYLNLWYYLRDQQREQSASAFRRLCRREYLHYLRVREWQDLYRELRQAAAEVGISTGPGRAELPADPGARQDLADRVHMSLLAGLLSHLGMRDTSRQARGKGRGPAEFAGARGARFAIFPDSVLARKPPEWVMAAELVETSRLWARTVARIQPEWAEPLAAHLVRRSYGEPQWDGRRGAATVPETVTLYGLPVAARKVSYGKVDPAAAREMFIQHALVEGDWHTHHAFFAENRRRLEDAAELERRARRRGLVAGDDAVFGFYDRRIPAGVSSARHFDSWWKRARKSDPDLLTMSQADLAGPAAGEADPARYPDSWDGLPLSYEFAPGDPEDGVTVTIPLTSLGQVSGEEFAWQVPGLREELVTELIRSLPKNLRTLFVPAPDTARAVLTRLGPPHGDLLDALSSELGRIGGVPVPRDAWDTSRLPGYLRMTFRVVDCGQVIAAGKDLDALRKELRPRLEAALAEAGQGITRTGLRGWDLGALPRTLDSGGIHAFPALVDEGETAGVALFASREEADEAMWRGTRRLLLIAVPSGAAAAARNLPAAVKLAMSRHPYPSTTALLGDCAAAAADQVIADAGGPAWDAPGFARLLERARASLPDLTAGVVRASADALAAAQQAEARLAESTSPVLAPAATDVRAQLSGLIHAGFVSETGAKRLPDLPRYLRAIVLRLDKAAANPGRDADRMAAVHRATQAWRQALAGLRPGDRRRAEAQAVRWMIEELRVSLFAQSLGARAPVSEQRIAAALARLAGT
jgi:ATP-dependent helicase HrpA